MLDAASAAATWNESVGGRGSSGSAVSSGLDAEESVDSSEMSDDGDDDDDESSDGEEAIPMSVVEHPRNLGRYAEDEEASGSGSGRERRIEDVDVDGRRTTAGACWSSGEGVDGDAEVTSKVRVFGAASIVV